MKRRSLVVAAGGVSLLLSGCLEDWGDSDDEYQHGYVLELDDSKEAVDDSAAVCSYEDLPTEAQVEFRRTIEDGRYRPEEPPVLAELECVTKYIEYEGRYYRIGVSVEGG